MKKLSFPSSRNLPPLRLYLDDLRRIVECIPDDERGELSIEACGYECSSVDELTALGLESTNTIIIRSLEANISIELSPSRGWLYVGSGSLEAKGLFAELGSVLLSCRKPFNREVPTWCSTLLTLVLLAVCSIVLFTSGMHSGTLWSILTPVLMAIVLVAGSYVFVNLRFKNYNTIIFATRKDRPGFWKRNSDEMLKDAGIAIVSSVVGAGVGALITYWLTKP